ncbi:MAG TPA: tripartite tricarboxylate transporter substrate binding protein [Burkholderiaceae bacterium]|nr:tripartite tricarboxylate transporter substrate binding protein [Burkholderiaceae bacterium]
MKSIRLAGVLIGTAVAAASVASHAQDWPQAAIHVVVPFDAGSTPDLVARIISERLAARLPQPVVIDNKSGAAGNLGTDAVAKAAPNGQTIGVSIAGPLAVNPLLFKKMPYDAARDLDLITVAVSQPSVLVFGSKRNPGTSKDLIALLKSGKTQATFGSIGAGSISHLAMETLAARAGGDFVHVPYRGSGAAVTALISGDIDMALLPAAAVMPFVKDGKLRAVAVASAKRSPSLPDLPTLSEAGLADVQADAWVGFIAPAKTPPAVVSKLHELIVQILAEPAIKEKLRDRYMDPVGNSPAEFRALLAADVARWKPIIAKNRIALD